MTDNDNGKLRYINKDRASPKVDNMSEVVAFGPKELEALKIVNANSDNSVHLKAFRDLRTRLMKLSKRESFSCLVTSVVAGGGTYVAVNLASIIALDKKRTSLLVDANLYQPYADSLLPVSSQVGLTDFLDDESIGVQDILYASAIPRVRVIPAGNNLEGGTEKIHSDRMKLLFDEVRSRYSDRYIIVDSPAALEYDAEVSILADLCDFVLLVVPYGKVSELQLQAAIDKIGPQRLAGVVFNQC